MIGVIGVRLHLMSNGSMVDVEVLSLRLRGRNARFSYHQLVSLVSHAFGERFGPVRGGYACLSPSLNENERGTPPPSPSNSPVMKKIFDPHSGVSRTIFNEECPTKSAISNTLDFAVTFLFPAN